MTQIPQIKVSGIFVICRMNIILTVLNTVTALNLAVFIV